MLARIAAQGLSDGLAAVALTVHVRAVLRRGWRSPLELRLILAFGVIGAFFACRAAAELLGLRGLMLPARLCACTLPVFALILAEGVLRRHAPRALKAAITAGTLTLGVALLALGPSAAWSQCLGVFLSTGLLAVVTLLIKRDRSSLSYQENASISAFVLAGIGLVLLDMPDFLADAPMAMSGLGAALLVFFTRLNPTSLPGLRQALADLALIAGLSAILAIGLAQALGMSGTAGIARLVIVILALGITLATLLGGLRDHPEFDEARALRAALARAETSGLSAFLEGLADQPMLRGLRIAEGQALAEYDQASLGAVLGARLIWTRSALADPDDPAPAMGRDELADLMASLDASHAGLISAVPLRIALLTLPALGPQDGAELDLALFCKLAVIAGRKGP
jgi:hypothetical protein